VETGITIKEENKDKNNITTDSGDKSDIQFDYNSESSFDNNVNSNKDKQDKDIE
jgi:hypothetical protein